MNKNRDAGNFPDVRKNKDLDAVFPEAYKNEIIKLGGNLHEIDQKFAFLGPYSFETDIIGCQERVNSIHINRMFIGARLCRIREHEGQDRFLETISMLNIQKTAAYEAILLALKFINEVGEIKYPNIVATLGLSKLTVITHLGEKELEVLDAGGTAAGLTLEAMDESSVREIRKKFKDVKNELGKKTKLLADKNVELDEYRARLKELESGSKPAVDWSARSAEMLSELNKILMDASQLNGRLNALVDEVHGMQETEWTKEESVCLQQAKFVASTISDDASVTVDRLDWLAPKVNAAFFPGLNFNRGHAAEADDADYTVVDGEGEDA